MTGMQCSGCNPGACSFEIDESTSIGQIKWERDTAIAQLESYGIGFCEEKKDLVEVVRCRDCEKKTSAVNVCGNVHCGLFRFWINADAFCAYGESKTRK